MLQQNLESLGSISTPNAIKRRFNCILQRTQSSGCREYTGLEGRDAGDLDHVVWIRQAFYDYQGTRWRISLIVLISNPVITLAIFGIREVDRGHHQVIQGGAGLLEHSLEIFKDLLRLGFDIALADHVMVFVDGRLAGDKEQFAWLRDDSLRIAWSGIRQTLRLNDFFHGLPHLLFGFHPFKRGESAFEEWSPRIEEFPKQPPVTRHREPQAGAGQANGPAFLRFGRTIPDNGL